MKFIKFFLLSGMMIGFYAYADTSPTESSAISKQIAACYHTEQPSYCLKDTFNKEQKKSQEARLALVGNLKDLGNDNSEKLTKELSQGDTFWNSAAEHDCRAYGLLYDDGSEAYNDNYSVCFIKKYAERIDYYHSFDIGGEKQSIDQLMKEYKAKKK